MFTIGEPSIETSDNSMSQADIYAGSTAECGLPGAVWESSIFSHRGDGKCMSSFNCV